MKKAIIVIALIIDVIVVLMLINSTKNVSIGPPDLDHPDSRVPARDAE